VRLRSQATSESMLISFPPPSAALSIPFPRRFPTSPFLPSPLHPTSLQPPTIPLTAIMPNPLPTELLTHIIQLAAPINFSPSSYPVRRSLLFNCCLASKQLCAIAQPLLPEVYSVWNYRDAKMVDREEDQGKRWATVQLLVLEDICSATCAGAAEVRQVLLACSQAEEVRVLGDSFFEIEWLSLLPSESASPPRVPVLGTTLTHLSLCRSALLRG
jgi:hypothetical protein